jgi:hypothetical protein
MVQQGWTLQASRTISANGSLMVICIPSMRLVFGELRMPRADRSLPELPIFRVDPGLPELRIFQA